MSISLTPHRLQCYLKLFTKVCIVKLRSRENINLLRQERIEKRVDTTVEVRQQRQGESERFPGIQFYKCISVESLQDFFSI